jgi:Na+/phosphate symporter
VLLSRITPDSHYFPMIAVPMLLLGTGIGTALTPLTTAGVAGVAPEDAGAASGLVNVAQQLGASLGLGILVTVFAAASHTPAHPAPHTSAARAADAALAHGVASALRGSALFLALALVVVVTVMWRPAARAEQAEASALATAVALED